MRKALNIQLRIPPTEMDEGLETAQLVRLVQRGDEDAFAALFYRYHNLVYGIALASRRSHVDDEDISQEVWLKAHQKIHSLRSEGAFASWLVNITRNLCADAGRRQARIVHSLAEGAEDDPASRLTDSEDGNLAWEALGAIPPRQSVALYLREVQSYDYGRIAAILNTSQTAVAMLLFRARKGLSQSYNLLERSPQKRCRLARKVMETIVDGEGSEIERRALDAHLKDCSACQGELKRLRRTSRSLALPPFLSQPLLPMASAPLQTAVVGGLSKLGLLFATAKFALSPAFIVGGIASAVSLDAPQIPNEHAPNTAVYEAFEPEMRTLSPLVSPGSGQPAFGLIQDSGSAASPEATASAPSHDEMAAVVMESAAPFPEAGLLPREDPSLNQERLVPIQIPLDPVPAAPATIDPVRSTLEASTGQVMEAIADVAELATSGMLTLPTAELVQSVEGLVIERNAPNLGSPSSREISVGSVPSPKPLGRLADSLPKVRVTPSQGEGKGSKGGQQGTDRGAPADGPLPAISILN
jgi:RNA polymerase sigma-70 factor (ECF subfamily)